MAIDTAAKRRSAGVTPAMQEFARKLNLEFRAELNRLAERDGPPRRLMSRREEFFPRGY